MECQKCKKILSKKGSHFICQGLCQGTFHRSCVRGLAADMKAGKNRIYCNNCEDEGSDIEEPEEEIQGFEKILKDIQRKVSAIPGLKKRLDTIQQSMSVLSDKYDSLLSEQAQAKDKIVKLEKSVMNITNKCVYLEKCNIALEQKVQEIEQSSLKHNIEIVGVEHLPGENVKELVTKIGDKMGVSSNDIEWARRSRPPKQGSKPPSIIVGFRTTGIEAWNSWLTKRRTLTDMKSDVLTGGLMTNKIYINEDLPKTTKSLIWNAEKQLHGIYEFVWVTNGKVLVKKTEGEQAIWIRTESDLNELLRTK